MKTNDLYQIDKKYQRAVPIISLLTVLCLFLPYINWEATKLSKTGVQVLFDCLNKSSEASEHVYITSLIIISLSVGIIATVVTIFIRKKIAFQIAAILNAVNFFCYLIMLFTARKTMTALGYSASVINSEGVSETSLFMVKYFQFGFWLALILSFIGIIMAMKTSKTSSAYVILIILSIIWLMPIAWVIMTSFRAESGSYTPYFLPKGFTFNNYIKLFTDTEQFYFARWFANTFFVAVCSCILTTFMVLSTAFAISRLRFKTRKLYMNLLLILGMFPGFMAMIAVYYILKGVGLTQSLVALILVYSGGAALTYLIAKGFFDTIPKALDEAACIDGATKWQVFTRITLPLSKPIVIYTILTSFIAPWLDFIFAKFIMGDNYNNYTVALGLWTMLQREYIQVWYTRFAAGAVVISIPISILFICMQKFYVEGLSGSVKG